MEIGGGGMTAPFGAQCRVIVDWLNIRAAPRKAAKITGKLSAGQLVTCMTAVLDGGYVWREITSGGWAAEQTVSGFGVYLQEIPLIPESGDGVRLGVEWLSQLDRVTSPGSFDCGQACIAMLMRFYGRGSGSINVKDLTDIVYGKTTAKQLQQLAGRFSLSLLQNVLTNDVPGFLRLELDRGKPIILLVNYADLGFKNHLLTGIQQGYHWLVVVGYEGDSFQVHDPLWLSWQDNGQSGRGGGFLKITASKLTFAARVGRLALV